MSRLHNPSRLRDFVGEFVGSLPALIAIQSHTFHTSPQGPSNGLPENLLGVQTQLFVIWMVSSSCTLKNKNNLLLMCNKTLER